MNFRLALVITALSIFALPARSDMILGIQPGLLAAPGSTGNTLDIVIRNTGPGDVHIESISFEIDTTDTNIVFTQSGFNPTTAPYIFLGNSFALTNGLSLNLLPPGQAMDGIDNTNDGGYIVFAAGSTLGLGRVSYDVLAAAAVPSSARITFDLANTILSDENGNAIPFTAQDGAITVVPEPATLGMGAAALAFLLWRLRRR